MTEIEKHLDNYGAACNALLLDFLKKHEWELGNGYWIGDKTGETWCINEEMVINMYDIVTDLVEEAPKEAYEEWYDYCMRCISLGIKETPNYYSFIHGCPRHSDEYLSKLEKLKEDFEEQIRKCNEGKFQNYDKP